MTPLCQAVVFAVVDGHHMHGQSEKRRAVWTFRTPTSLVSFARALRALGAARTGAYFFNRSVHGEWNGDEWLFDTIAASAGRSVCPRVVLGVHSESTRATTRSAPGPGARVSVRWFVVIGDSTGPLRICRAATLSRSQRRWNSRDAEATEDVVLKQPRHPTRYHRKGQAG